MPDPADVYEIEACGQVWKLYWNNRALRLIERELGYSIRDNRRGVLDVTVMLYGGLLHYQPTATIDTADRILDDIGFAGVADVVAEGMASARPFRATSGTEQKQTVSSPGSDQTSSGD